MMMALADEVLPVPSMDLLFNPLPNSSLVQPLSKLFYWLQGGCAADQPRNLAKSVTIF
jgi:hypothetical protein